MRLWYNVLKSAGGLQQLPKHERQLPNRNLAAPQEVWHARETQTTPTTEAKHSLRHLPTNEMNSGGEVWPKEQGLRLPPKPYMCRSRLPDVSQTTCHREITNKPKREDLVSRSGRGGACFAVKIRACTSGRNGTSTLYVAWGQLLQNDRIQQSGRAVLE